MRETLQVLSMFTKLRLSILFENPYIIWVVIYYVRVFIRSENFVIMWECHYRVRVFNKCKSDLMIWECLYFKEVSMHSESGYTSLPRLYSWLSDNPIVPLFLATIFLIHNLTYINNL